MPNTKPVQLRTPDGKPRALTAHDGKKIVGELIVQLMEKQNRTSTETSLLTKLLREYREYFTFIDTRKKLSKMEKELDTLSQKTKKAGV